MMMSMLEEEFKELKEFRMNTVSVLKNSAFDRNP
jgi:hypothetical protein